MCLNVDCSVAEDRGKIPVYDVCGEDKKFYIRGLIFELIWASANDLDQFFVAFRARSHGGGALFSFCFAESWVEEKL